MTGNSADHVGASMEEVPGPKVFVSYRRSDTGDVAEDVSARLRTDLGGSNLFRDKDDLIAGQRWRDALAGAIADSDAAMFLIGPGWTGSSDDGSRRIDDESDPVGSEARQAVSNATRCQPLPVLIDRPEPPGSLPPDIEPLFDHHAVSATRDGLRSRSSKEYQSILVGVWESIRQRTPRGVLIIGDHDASAQVDGLVTEMQAARQIDARRLSRFAAGACVVSARRLRKGARKWPDVIVLLKDDEPTETLRSRIQALNEHPSVRAVTLVGVGAAGLAAGYIGAQAVGSSAGASGATSITAASHATAALPHAGAGPLGGIATAWSNAAVAAKIGVAASAVAVAGVSGVAASGVLSSDGSPAAVLASSGPDGVACTDIAGLMASAPRMEAFPATLEVRDEQDFAPNARSLLGDPPPSTQICAMVIQSVTPDVEIDELDTRFFLGDEGFVAAASATIMWDPTKHVEFADDQLPWIDDGVGLRIPSQEWSRDSLSYEFGTIFGDFGLCSEVNDDPVSPGVATAECDSWARTTVGGLEIRASARLLASWCDNITTSSECPNSGRPFTPRFTSRMAVVEVGAQDWVEEFIDWLVLPRSLRPTGDQS